MAVRGKWSTNRIDPPQTSLGIICLLFVFEAGSLCVIKVSPKLLAILLPRSPRCWDYRHGSMSVFMKCKEQLEVNRFRPLDADLTNREEVETSPSML